MLNILATILAVALVAGGQAGAKPNFSGEWKMNAAKSNFGPVPAPSLMTRSITHAEPNLAIVEQQKSDMGDQNATRKYVTDGSPSTFQANGADVKTAATWKGNTLVVVSSVDAIGLGFTDTMSLSDGGKTLTSQVRISSPQGDIDVVIVFEKQ